MQIQIKLPFSQDRKPCQSVRRSKRAQWAHLWFRRMHELVEEAGATSPTHQSKPAPSSETRENAFKKN